METWGIHDIEFIWFKSTADGMRAADIYQTMTGEDADTTQTNRSPSPAAPHLSLATGVIREQVHFVGVQPGRIDYTISSPDRRTGPWPWKLEEGIKVAERALGPIEVFTARLGRPTRIAVHMNLIKNVATIEEANNLILPKVGIERSSGPFSDLLFQLNKPVPSKIDGYTVNRLMKFSTGVVQLIAIRLGEEAVSTSGAPERYLAALNLDINTAPVPRGIEPADANAIFRELVSEAADLARAGTLEGFLKR